MHEVYSVGGGGDITEAVTVGGVTGGLIGYYTFGPVGAGIGAFYGGAVGLAWGLGSSAGGYLYGALVK